MSTFERVSIEIEKRRNRRFFGHAQKNKATIVAMNMANKKLSIMLGKSKYTDEFYI